MLTQVKPVGLEVRGLARHAQRDHRTVAKLVDETVELVDARVDLLVRVRVRLRLRLRARVRVRARARVRVRVRARARGRVRARGRTMVARIVKMK